MSTGDRPRCRSCQRDRGDVVLDLGLQPACDHFPPPLSDGFATTGQPPPEPSPQTQVYPLRLWLCRDCGLAQLAEDATTPEEPRGVEPAVLRAQAAAAVTAVASAGLLEDRHTVIEFGSPHGGSWLHLLAEHDIRPAAGGCAADLVLDCFGMMHQRDQRAALAQRASLLAPGGLLLLQYHSLAAILACGEWNALRHGHFAYYSTPAIIGMAERVGLQVSAAWSFQLYGGTVLLAARATGDEGPAAGETVPCQELARLKRSELAEGVLDPARFDALQQRVLTSARALREFLEHAREAGLAVHGYGAASRAVVLLNRAGIGPELLPAVADASPAKHGRTIPGLGIPIISPARLTAAAPDVVLMLIPELLDEVRRDLPELASGPTRWLTTADLSQPATGAP